MCSLCPMQHSVRIHFSEVIPSCSVSQLSGAHSVPLQTITWLPAPELRLASKESYTYITACIACCLAAAVTMKITKGITWPLWTLALLTTLVFMAGLAALQVSGWHTGQGGPLVGWGVGTLARAKHHHRSTMLGVHGVS